MTRYLRYELENVEPVRIADDSVSQSDQTATLRYIPGTTIKGLVIGALSGDKDFESIKKSLFSDRVRYLNAYLQVGEHELLPSPKGFYEDKTQVEGKKKLENVVIDGNFSDGQKRASLGRFACLEGDCVYYYGVDTGSDLKIKFNLEAKEKRNVFREEYIQPHYHFVGYIAVQEQALEERIQKVFDREIILGNARSAGMGKCRVISCAYVDRLPYEEYLPDTDLTGECYMMLASNTVMRDKTGAYCGMDWSALSKKLGVEDLEPRYCSTSTVEVRGYNRTLGIHTPAVKMYAQGSVFHLCFKGTLKKESMRRIVDEGIGVRRNEGFGRILFLKDYETVQYKLAGSATEQKQYAPAELDKRDRQVMQKAAKVHCRQMIDRGMQAYVVKNPIRRGTVSNSQLGQVEAIVTAYKYDPAKARTVLDAYLGHAQTKQEKNAKHQKRSDFNPLQKAVDQIMNSPLEELLGITLYTQSKHMGVDKKDLFTSAEEDRMRLELIEKLIRYDNKKGE